MVTQKAIVATVKLGKVEIEGLMLSDGDFAIAVIQIHKLFPSICESQKYASQYLKRLLGERFKSHKIKTELSKNSILVVTLKHFEFIVAKLDRAGIIEAQDFRDDLVGLSLHQLFCDAFKVKFDAEDRQQWVSARQSVKETFRKSLTDSLKAYGYTEPWQYGKFVHAMQQSCGIVDGTRDELTTQELSHLMAAQATIGGLVNAGIEPYKALKIWIDRN